MSVDDDTKPPGLEPPANKPSDTDFELNEGDDLPPLPANMPPDFRARLATALKTTAPDVLAAAEEGYRGVYPGCDEYIHDLISQELPPHLHWVLACTVPEQLRARYENDEIVLWSIPLAANRVMVFESLRHGAVAFQVPLGSGRVTVYAKREPR